MQWRTDNITWYNTQKALKNADGTPYYTQLAPDWYLSSGVLIHWFNDTTLTSGNLVPMATSTVDVIYQGRLYNDTIFDNSYALKINGDSIYRSQVNNNIDGWTIALTHMHVGDSVEVIIPYSQAYGTEGSGSIAPYSVLRFNMKLVDVYRYETPYY